MQRTLGAVIASLLMITDAQAGGSLKDVAAPDASWRGFYLGANVGYGWADDDVVGIGVTNGLVFADTGTLNSTGAFAGLQGGLNLQFQWLVLGGEADIQWSGLEDSFGPNRLLAPAQLDVTANTDINWFGTLRGRVGIANGRLLLYATAGWAWADIDYTVRAVDAVGNNATMRKDGTRSGYVLGAGAEWAFAPRWSGKLEYQLIELGAEPITAPVLTAAGVPNGLTTRTIENHEFQTIRLGLNYRFGQGD